ncbi:MAG: hypothetical protein H7256_06000 [Bdellovibrio sp.]|nr:hypothetical protein [Bdellovibrio sp.]
MLKQLSLLLLGCGLFVACQQAPTKTLEETSNSIFKVKTVLVDTRDAFSYTSFHIPGSVNLVSNDFLVLKNPATKRYIMDPNLTETIDRLARKGLAPDRRIILMSTTKNSGENKKWHWLLKNLGFEDIDMTSVDEFNSKNKNARYLDPERADVWILKLSPELQQEFILKKGSDCFVKYSDKVCGS